jgi:hypothetical protein
MQLLITKQDILDVKDISNHTTLERINEYIADAQTMDLCPLLGNGFYFDVLTNYASANYQTLINGSSFDVNGCTWISEGLKRVLVEFAWGRYTYFGVYNDTPFGNVIKTTEWSQPTNDNSRKDIWKQNQQRANMYFESVSKYLDLNTDIFTKWKTSCNDGCEPKGKGFKINLI